MSIKKLNNLINTDAMDLLGEGKECGAIGCREWCHKDTDWCFTHQYKEDEEIGFLLSTKIAEKLLK